MQRDGIRFASTRYVSPVIAAYVGQTVTVRYDPRDAAELRVYHHDQYLCRAIAPELAADAVTLQQLQHARTARTARSSSSSSANGEAWPTPCPSTSGTCPRWQTSPSSPTGPTRTLTPWPPRQLDAGCGPMPPTDRAAERSLLDKHDDGRRFLTAAVGELSGHPPAEPAPTPEFLVTREHRYIGLCWGPPGVGKTLSARRYAGTPVCRTGSSGSAIWTQPPPGPAPDRSRRGSADPDCGLDAYGRRQPPRGRPGAARA